MTDPKAQQELVKALHLLKTDLFMELVETGAMPLRPGVKRLVTEAMAAGVPVAVCSTSNERAVSTIVRVMLGPEVAAKMRVFAGDCVPKKKPAPDIYLLAAKELKVRFQCLRTANISRRISILRQRGGRGINQVMPLGGARGGRLCCACRGAALGKRRPGRCT